MDTIQPLGVDLKKDVIDDSEKVKRAGKDPNRELMMKFKYDTITTLEMRDLHDQLEKLIYDIIKKNFTNTEFKDVYQEIWRKITKSKHSWNENKGTYVSTWIVCVCMSVINGLRLKNKKQRNRYCLYEDFIDEDGSGHGEEVAIKSGMIENNPLKVLYFSEVITNFLSSLDEKEKEIVDLIFDTGYEELNESNGYRYNKKKITNAYIKNKLGIANNDFAKVLKKLKYKFNKEFNQEGGYAS